MGKRGIRDEMSPNRMSLPIMVYSTTNVAYTIQGNGLPLKSRVNCTYPYTLTFTNSTFSPHSEFMRCVWISEQTAIISLFNINHVVFIIETGCVYCEARNEFLEAIIQ